MKKLILLGFMGLCTIPVIAQTITAPVGQSLTITNPVDITIAGGTLNVPNDGSFNIGGIPVIRIKSGGNVFFGTTAGNASTTGSNNLCVGDRAGRILSTGGDNLILGGAAGYSITTGNTNVFLGAVAGFQNTSGRDNVFLGYNSGGANVTGLNNIYLGSQSGNTATGDYNTYIGYASGANNPTGSQNTFIGHYANGTSGVSNAAAIGNGAFASTSNSFILGNINNNVGIGNTAPNAKLEITATSGSGLRFTNLTSGSATTPTSGSNKVLSVNANGDVILVQLAGSATTTSSNPVAESTWKNADGYLYNNSTNGVVINGAGLDGNALIVKGGVLSKEVNVKVEGAESWPDYVFKPSYKRMSLEEVEKFIAINGHLPNVASATEMAATGNNLNKTDIKLLEKVEELTLYLLEMKKANDAQSAEIQSLKKQMSKLRKK
ncbi:hypothetical protein VB796_19575 [Arcicella sp. LKC2W]|uniref:bZIP transcription factor n=1 Tax=Arcicella sp. LKC2W TaxID=2984198 RepID=UPI002B20FB01|nr:bZIP transcription factor [Arcicella sp. LKC2W]MEA5461273.1 hypothetical protein [Arcicella sp. LKC2W]